MRAAIALFFAFPPVRWLCAAGSRHVEQELREVFEGEPYRVRYTLCGSTTGLRQAMPVPPATSDAESRDAS